MFTLVYVSSAVRLFTQVELIAMLAQAYDKNRRLGITGLLLYHDGNFMQALEGSEKEVQELYATIRMDERHRGVITLLEMEIEKRGFAHWGMGFHDLKDTAIRSLPGFSEFLDHPLDVEKLRKDTSQAMRLLRVFRHMHEPSFPERNFYQES